MGTGRKGEGGISSFGKVIEHSERLLQLSALLGTLGYAVNAVAAANHPRIHEHHNLSNCKGNQSRAPCLLDSQRLVFANSIG